MNSKKLKLILRIVLSLAALAIILYKVDLSKAWYYLSRANWLLVVFAVLSFALSKVLAAFRINRFYRTQNLVLSERLNLKLNFLGMFYNLFIPLIGGEGYKAIWIRKRHTIKIKKLVSSALLDRASGMAALIFLTAAFFMLSQFQIAFKPLVLLAVPLAYAVHYLVMRLFFKSFLSAWGRTHLLSIGVQLLQAFTTYFVIRALHIDQQIIDYLFVFMLASFAFVLPLIGAREMAFVFGAQYLGLDMEISLAISLLFYLSLAFSSLLGAYFLFVPESLEKEYENSAFD